MLSETRSTDSLEDLLPGYSITHVPASRAGFAGEGLLLAVKHSRLYSVMDFASDDSSLWVTLSFTRGHQPLTFGVCYIPPAGSPKLRDIGLQERFAHVTAHAVAAKSLARFLLGAILTHMFASQKLIDMATSCTTLPALLG